MASQPLKVLVIDDSAIYRQNLCNVLRSIASVKVVGTAKNGEEGLEKIAELDPDAVTLDYEMPKANGLQVLRKMKKRGDRAKAIMVSSYTAEGARVTADALLEGAFDFVLKPSKGTPDQNRDELKLAITERLSLVADTLGREVTRKSDGSDEGTLSQTKCKAVLIGASTGGPVVLRQVLAELPGDLPVPVIVVQHMPQTFTGPLARRLNEICKLDVLETHDGQRLRAGAIYVAAGGHHTKITLRNKQVIAKLTDDPPENSCRPAVDFTLRSAVETYGKEVLAVIHTGMGKDGREGCRALKEVGGHVIAQHGDDCTVYGMPKAVIDAKLADRVIRLPRIAKAIKKTVMKGKQ